MIVDSSALDNVMVALAFFNFTGFFCIWIVLFFKINLIQHFPKIQKLLTKLSCLRPRKDPKILSDQQITIISLEK